jgi:hypothetical protein
VLISSSWVGSVAADTIVTELRHDGAAQAGRMIVYSSIEQMFLFPGTWKPGTTARVVSLGGVLAYV